MANKTCPHLKDEYAALYCYAQEKPKLLLNFSVKKFGCQSNWENCERFKEAKGIKTAIAR